MPLELSALWASQKPFLDFAHLVLLKRDERLMVRPAEWHDVPGLVIGDVECDDLRPQRLHREAEKATRRSHLEHALAFQVDATQVVTQSFPQIPGALDELPRDVHRVVEAAIVETRHVTRLLRRSTGRSQRTPCVAAEESARISVRVPLSIRGRGDRGC